MLLSGTDKPHLHHHSQFASENIRMIKNFWIKSSWYDDDPAFLRIVVRTKRERSGPIFEISALLKHFFVVLTQFGYADSKSAPFQALFCLFLTQNSTTKWPRNFLKMSQLYITAWLTMSTKTSFRCLK